MSDVGWKPDFKAKLISIEGETGSQLGDRSSGMKKKSCQLLFFNLLLLLVNLTSINLKFSNIDRIYTFVSKL